MRLVYQIIGSLLFSSLIQFHWCIIKHLKNTKLYPIEFLRTEMTSDPSNYHREYSPYGSYSLFQFEISDVISVVISSIEYSFVFFKCLRKHSFQVSTRIVGSVVK